MSDVFDKILGDIDNAGEMRDSASLQFYAFEPWDVVKREQWIYDLAVKDGIDLLDDKMLKHIGMDPHPFQTGYLMSSVFLRSLLAGSQEGKSFCDLMESIIVTTGEVPISLRFPSGYDTGIKRLVTDQNILRFGRRDSKTGKLIDFDVDAKRPEGWSEWDCGNILGAGVFPKKKIMNPGDQAWIGTFMKAMNNYWWPRFHDKGKMIIPPFLIDKKRGNEGYSVELNTVYLIRDTKIVVITYESGFERFEAEMAGKITLDEEPEDERIFHSAQQHGRCVSIIETPYQGITYTKDLLFPDQRNANVAVFHACQFDSPYQKKDDILMRRETMPVWERGSRIWGMHSEIRGAPYYDRTKILAWINRYAQVNELYEFIPSDVFDGCITIERTHGVSRGLMDVGVSRIKAEKEDKKSVWRVYEDVKDGVAYVMSADPAEGEEDPEKVGDLCCAHIWRCPMQHEKKPVLVAALDSTLPTVQFARVCLLAARYHNNCLLGAETKRGFANATFASEAKDWPFWYKMITIQQSTRQPRKQIGFDTNIKTRDSMYDYIGKWLSEFSIDDHPMIPDRPLLIELAAAIKGKGGRCDHTRDGNLDRATCFGIFLYIYEHSKDQITCNVAEKKRKRSIFDIMRGGRERTEQKSKAPFGTGMKNLR